MENTQVMVIMNRYITVTDIRIDRINPTTHITVSRKSFIIVHFLVRIYMGNLRPFFDPEKVHLEHVDLEDQKVRLRAVWMGRNLGGKIGVLLGSRIRVIFMVLFWALFWTSKRA